jgi:hypothetical protein
MIHQLHFKFIVFNICFLRRDIIEGLEKVGFKTNLGIDGSGIIEMVLEKGGGYYIGFSVPFLLVVVY